MHRVVIFLAYEPQQKLAHSLSNAESDLFVYCGGAAWQMFGTVLPQCIICRQFCKILY